MRPYRLGIVADDLTGAADSAVPFAEAGRPTELLLHGTHQAPATVLAVATGVRAFPDDEAAVITARAVRELAELGCDRIYLKVDSTMRGSVAGQLRGALRAWSGAHPDPVAVLCPAFYEQKRTVVAGRVFVDGVPLDESAAAKDPKTPVRHSLLEHLVPGALALGSPSTGSRIFYADASSEADLDTVATVVDHLGPTAIGAGSAGLASALARLWSGPGRPVAPAAARRILVAVSSLHPTAVSALKRLREDEATLSATDIVTTPAEAHADPSTIATDFGRDVARALRQKDYDALVLVGGDGAAAVLKEIGAASLDIHANLLPGVPRATIRGGPADGLNLITRSGGFGDHAGLDRIVRLLRGPN